MRRMPRYVLTSLRLYVLALAACSPAANAPTLIAVGNVWTGDSANPAAQAVAVRGDAIIAVGDSASVLATAGKETRVLRGAMVVPGLMDDHTHFVSWGETLASVDLRDAS